MPITPSQDDKRHNIEASVTDLLAGRIRKGSADELNNGEIILRDGETGTFQMISYPLKKISTTSLLPRTKGDPSKSRLNRHEFQTKR